MPEFTRIRYCLWCGDPFELKSPNQKYCRNSHKNCSQESKKESWRKASSKYRNKYKETCNISSVYKLGSGFLGCIPEENFELEAENIKKEKKRLKLGQLSVGTATFLTVEWMSVTEDLFNRGIIYVLESFPYLIISFLLVAVLIVASIYLD